MTNYTPGPWSEFRDDENHDIIAAETLAGIKQFITEQLEQDRRMGAQ